MLSLVLVCAYVCLVCVRQRKRVMLSCVALPQPTHRGQSLTPQSFLPHGHTHSHMQDYTAVCKKQSSSDPDIKAAMINQYSNSHAQILVYNKSLFLHVPCELFSLFVTKKQANTDHLKLIFCYYSDLIIIMTCYLWPPKSLQILAKPEEIFSDITLTKKDGIDTTTT